jgi:hypothetical protein
MRQPSKEPLPVDLKAPISTKLDGSLALSAGTIL